MYLENYYVPLKAVVETVINRGQTSEWLNCQYKKLLKKKKTYKGVVPYDYILMQLEISSNPHIFKLFYKIWTPIIATTLTKIIIKTTRGKWGEYFTHTRKGSSTLIQSVSDLYRLKPKYRFFEDNYRMLIGGTSISNIEKIEKFLKKISFSVKSYIKESLKNKEYSSILIAKSYESFYYIMLNYVLYGVSLSEAFCLACKESSDTEYKNYSKKELNTEFIENFSSIQKGEQDNDDYENLNLLLDLEGMKKSLYNKIRWMKMDTHIYKNCTQEKIQRIVDEDYHIFVYTVEGYTLVEIKEIMKLTCTRQAIAHRRDQVMALAKEVFAELRT